MLYYLLDFIKDNSLGSKNIANGICSCSECIYNDLKTQWDINFSASRISYSDFGDIRLVKN